MKNAHQANRCLLSGHIPLWFNKAHLVVAMAVFFSMPWFTSCKQEGRSFSFIVCADTHFNGIDSLDAPLNRFAAQLNTMWERPLPDSLALHPSRPRGIVIVGDLTEDGHPEEWKAFTNAFGLQGEGRVEYPVFEGFGNHDGNIGGAVREGIRKRNKSRQYVTTVSENGLHYAWQWEGIHLLQLNLYPSAEWDPNCGWCHFFHESFREPQNSLGFLEYYLEKYVEPEHESVLLFFHYGWDDFSGLWWTEEEKQAFYEAISNYSIAGVFTGHRHIIEHHHWKGLDIWSVGSPKKPAGEQEFVMVHVEGDSLYVLASKGDTWIKSWSKTIGDPL